MSLGARVLVYGAGVLGVYLVGAPLIEDAVRVTVQSDLSHAVQILMVYWSRHTTTGFAGATVDSLDTPMSPGNALRLNEASARRAVLTVTNTGNGIACQQTIGDGQGPMACVTFTATPSPIGPGDSLNLGFDTLHASTTGETGQTP